MTPDVFSDRKLYAYLLGGAALAALLLKLCACGGDGKKPADVPKLMSCAEKVLAIVTETPNCADIGRKVDELLAAQAECFEALTGERAISWSCADGGR
jgi:hypothetical protein